MLLAFKKGVVDDQDHSFNGHPPLGVNATLVDWLVEQGRYPCFNGHPPLGVNAT